MLFAVTSARADLNLQYQAKLEQVRVDANKTMACIQKQYKIAKSLQSEIPVLIKKLQDEKLSLAANHCNLNKSVAGELIEFEQKSFALFKEATKLCLINKEKLMKPFGAYILNGEWNLKVLNTDYSSLDELKKTFKEEFSELLEAKEKLSKWTPTSNEISTCEEEFNQQLSSVYSLAYFQNQMSKQQN